MAHKFDKKNLLLFFASFTLDRISKYLVLHGIITEQYINRFFNITISHNYGIAWGIGNDCNHHAWLITIIVACALLYFISYAIIQTDKMINYASTLIIAGGLSNFFDRMYYGSVIDFVQLHMSDCYFPTFNIADVCISIGACLLCIAFYKDQSS